MPEEVAAVSCRIKNRRPFSPLTAEPVSLAAAPPAAILRCCNQTQAIIDQPYQFDFYDAGRPGFAVLLRAGLRPMPSNVTCQRFCSRRLVPAAASTQASAEGSLRRQLRRGDCESGRGTRSARCARGSGAASFVPRSNNNSCSQ